MNRQEEEARLARHDRRPRPRREHSVFELDCANCGASVETTTPEYKCQNCGARGAVDHPTIEKEPQP